MQGLMAEAEVADQIRIATEDAYRRGHEAAMAKLAQSHPTGATEVRDTEKEPPRVHRAEAFVPPSSPVVPESTPATSDPKDSKLNVRDFDGTEIYTGFGTGFAEWADNFRAEAAMAEEACQYPWNERFKCSRLSYYLRGKALPYYASHSSSWWKLDPTLEYALGQLGSIYVTVLTSAQCSTLYQTKKASNVSWDEHLMFLIAEQHAINTTGALVLENIVKHASATMSQLLLSKLDTRRQDYVQHARELARTAVVTFKNACLSPKLAINLISPGSLMERGCHLATVNGRHAIMPGTTTLWYVVIKTRVVVVDGQAPERSTPPATFCVQNMILAAVDDLGTAELVTQHGTLLEFHRRFGHLAYDTIERLASDPTDLKRPITPQDRRGNRYLVNFVDHKSNYCRIFLAKTKDEAARKFQHFLVYFEKRFNVRVHVLRTDVGGEYANVDLFCRETGVARQITEANNQAGNGEAERMQRTVMNMVRCRLIGYALPLKVWGDAAEYAAYVLNRMPTRANLKRQAPLTVLAGSTPDLADVVTFGSPCTLYRDPKKNSLQSRGTPGLIIGKHEETEGFQDPRIVVKAEDINIDKIEAREFSEGDVIVFT
ncbi:TPA: hypothetical protein N0F65_008768 [Lagenidium giganteum]|uniref:Integrase catalytic domain-containing protein n=1 Tax=Lagenidium giganteum TaxID=4803 RepID=A0AAV2YZW7_9STRA|nr:TPA: hypothetical protein N0F65_008768 [Lagenidium giganteum]